MSLLSWQLLRRAFLDAKARPSAVTLAFNISPVQLRDPAVDYLFYRSLPKPDSVRAVWR
jgi:hypothetical protein